MYQINTHQYFRFVLDCDHSCDALHRSKFASLFVQTFDRNPNIHQTVYLLQRRFSVVIRMQMQWQWHFVHSHAIHISFFHSYYKTLGREFNTNKMVSNQINKFLNILQNQILKRHSNLLQIKYVTYRKQRMIPKNCQD